MTGLIRLAFTTDRDRAEAAERALDAGPAPPITCARFEDGDEWTVEALYGEAPEREEIVRILREALGGTPQFDLAPLPEQDWIAQSLAGLAPVRAGRFVVHGRHDRDAVPPGTLALEIDAGAAFGTGHHATTLGCLLAIDRVARTMARPRILDVGTGTGVLAIAAAKLWKVRVIASDIDPVAVAVTCENARINGVSPLIEAITAAGVSHPRIARGGPYDLVFANILAQPLVDLAGPVAAIALHRSKIILSGLLDAQSAMVFAPWRAHGFALERRLSIEGWTTLVLAR